MDLVFDKQQVPKETITTNDKAKPSQPWKPNGNSWEEIVSTSGNYVGNLLRSSESRYY